MTIELKEECESINIKCEIYDNRLLAKTWKKKKSLRWLSVLNELVHHLSVVSLAMIKQFWIGDKKSRLDYKASKNYKGPFLISKKSPRIIGSFYLDAK